MMSHGSMEWLRSEANRCGGPRRFECPKCHAKPRADCTRLGGYATAQTHKERQALWREYAWRAPTILAWMESRLLPAAASVARGDRRQGNFTPREILERTLEEAHMLLEATA